MTSEFAKSIFKHFLFDNEMNGTRLIDINIEINISTSMWNCSVIFVESEKNWSNECNKFKVIILD